MTKIILKIFIFFFLTQNILLSKTEYLSEGINLFNKDKNTHAKLSTDFIFYINRDEDTHKMERMEKMIEDINLPQERFSAICPTPEDITPAGKFYSFYKK